MESLKENLQVDILVCFFLRRINFVLATFTNSDVTDANEFQDSLDESFRDMRRLLLTSKV